jgi:ribonuclease P protein component
MPQLEGLKTRPEFLRVAGKGRKWAMPGLVLQAYRDPSGRDGEQRPLRVGFTASRKVGSAVPRNRARRRLRAVAAEVLPRSGRPGTDYVLIARAGTLGRPYAKLLADLETAVEKVERRR